MSTRKAKAGDVYAVDLGDGVLALCRIPYCSTFFKDVMLLTLHGRVTSEVDPHIQLAEPAIRSIYCATTAARASSWNLLFTTTVTIDDERLTLRNVGGGLWVGETLLRQMTEADVGVPKMLTYGDVILRKTLLTALTS